jgi:hypothetical protein
VRRLIGRLAAAVLLASFVSPSVVALRGPVARARDVSAERAAGMNAPAGPVVSALAAAVPVAMGASLSVAPRVLAVSRLVVGERLSEGNVRPPFVVKSAPTILRV